MRQIAWIAAALVAAPVAQAATPADTAAVQVALAARGLYSSSIDGVPGPGTSAGIRSLQSRAGLLADGVAGPATLKALGPQGRPRLGTRPIFAPATGFDVAALQWLLARAGFPSGGFDGAAGARTDRALRRFQQWAGLGADGVAGPATLAALQRAAPASPLRFATPVRARVGDRFGPRGTGFHSGIDYPAPSGAPVTAAGRGCVTFAAFATGGYGNLVIIEHRLGVTTWYAHLARIATRSGACLQAGSPVGTIGATGHASGPHLHFEIRLRGAAVNPLTGL